MKKNLPIIIVLIVVIVLVVLSFVFFVKPNSDSQTVIDNSTTDTTKSSSSSENEYTWVDEYGPIQNVNTDELKPGVEINFTDEDKTIDGVAYKSVNTITVDSNVNHNFAKYNKENIFDYMPDENYGSLYKDDTPVIPSYLVLMDDTQPAFYNYENEIYYIPIIKCNSEEDERIVFKDPELAIYKKDGTITYNSNVLGIKYNSDEYDFATLFDCYYLYTPDNNYRQTNVYRTDLYNTESSKEYVVTTFANSENRITDELEKTIIIINDSGEYQVCVVKNNIGTNVGDFGNLFFKIGKSYHTNESGELIVDDSALEYFLFEDGFKEILFMQ